MNQIESFLNHHSPSQQVRFATEFSLRPTDPSCSFEREFLGPRSHLLGEKNYQSLLGSNKIGSLLGKEKTSTELAGKKVACSLGFRLTSKRFASKTGE